MAQTVSQIFGPGGGLPDQHVPCVEGGRPVHDQGFMQQVIKYREQEGLSWSTIDDVRDTGFEEMAKVELLFWSTNLRKLNMRQFNPVKKLCKLVFGDTSDSGEGAHFDFEKANKSFILGTGEFNF